MSRFLRRIAGPMWAASLGIVVGCAEKPSVETSDTEANVKGIVKVDGVPATQGEINFNPANFKRKDATVRTAPIGKDGTYTIKTLTGENQVNLGGDLVKKMPVLGYQTRTADVRPGDNEQNFEFGSDKKAGEPSK